MTMLKSLLPIWILIFALCDAKVSTSFQDELESHSIFYGLVSQAAKTPRKSVCFRELSQTAENLLNGTKWAVKMYDASGTPRTGIHWGNTHWLGNKRQCEANMVIKKYTQSELVGPITVEPPESIPPFPVNYYGSYFVHTSDIQIILHFDNEFRITLGLCLPSSCAVSEITELLKKYFDSNKLHFQKIYNATFKIENSRKIVDDYSWLREDSTIILGCIFIVLIILAISGTYYDVRIYRPRLRSYRKALGYVKRVDSNGNIKYLLKKEDDQCDRGNGVGEGNAEDKPKPSNVDLNLWQKLLICFSTYKNNKFIFDTTTTEDSVNCIHGMRFLCMVYIIFGHTVLFLITFFDNRVYPFFIFDSAIGQIFANAHFGPDSFFCMSGYLLTFFFVKDECLKKRRGILSKTILFVDYAIKRFFRIFPSYAVAILFTATLTSWRVKSTIFWFNNRDDINCDKYWWRNILFINNLYPRREMCQAWSWYLSNDMQFYLIISSILIIGMTYLKLAISMLTFIFTSCIAYCTYVTYKIQYIPILDHMWAFRETFYDPPWMRINAYIVGTVAGYFVFKMNKTLPVERYVVRLLWTASVSVALVMLGGFGDYNMSLSMSMLYTPLSRIVWAINTAWVIIACETGNGGIANYIFSLKVWMPLSRLTFWAFFLNPIVMFFFGTYHERSFEANVYNNAIISPGFIVLTYTLSYVFALLLEVPCSNFFKTLSKHTSAPKKVHKKPVSINNNTINTDESIAEEKKQLKEKSI